MKGRCIRTADKAARDLGDKVISLQGPALDFSSRLTVGKEYLVYAIMVDDAGASFLIVDDEQERFADGYPVPLPSGWFEITQSWLTPTWRVGERWHKGRRTLVIGDEAWQREPLLQWKITEGLPDALEVWQTIRRMVERADPVDGELTGT